MFTPHQLCEMFLYVRRALVRHCRLAGGVVVVVIAVTLVATFLMPREYISEARLFVRFGRENLFLDPTATPSNGQMISIYESRESEINSLLEVLKSRAIVDRLVESLGAEYVLTGRGQPLPFQRRQDSLSETLIVPTARHRQAAALLDKSLEVWAPRKSNTITVRSKANRPQVAQEIAARLVAIYQEEYVRVHRTAGSHQFFVEQTRLSKKQWQAASDKLALAKDELGIVTIDGKKRLLQDQIGDVEMKLLGNRAELTAAEARIASLQSLVGGLPEKVLTQQAQAPNAAFDTMRGTLFQLESREQELASRMHDAHPQLTAVRQQLTDLRKVLREQPAQRVQTTHAVNPARQSLELALLNDQSQAEALRGREVTLRKLAGELAEDLRELNSREAALGQLQQEVDLAEARHKIYADKLEQARINRSLDEERISSLTLVQPASYPMKPTGPRKAYVLALGVMLGLVSGLGTALVAAYLNPILVTTAELERLLDLPLTGQIPAHSTADRGTLAA